MILNGKQMELKEEITVTALLERLNLVAEKVVVEVNLTILSKDRYAEIILKEEDKVEVVSFVGGG